jgi:prophage antirepressor-like protein|nr:MAG TPA: N BRO family, N-terminal domain [Caudoviricetes sp.]
MNNLKLVETDVFNEIATCDFWGNINNEYLVTREQIGRALGYKNPTNAIKNIHLKHKERLDKFSTQLTLGYVEGDRYVERERILYNRKGIMEICRWSRQPLADKFMDWCWVIMDKLISNSLNTVTLSREEYSMIVNAANEVGQLNKVNEQLTRQLQIISAQNTTMQDKLSRMWQKIMLIVPPVHYSSWKNKMSQKVVSLAKILGYTNDDDRKSIYGDIYSMMRSDYDIDLDSYKENYLLSQTDYKNVAMIDVIDNDIALRDIFEEIVDRYIQIKSGLEVINNA